MVKDKERQKKVNSYSVFMMLLVVMIPVLTLSLNRSRAAKAQEYSNTCNCSQYYPCPIPGPNRQYPCCIFHRVPYVANLLETAQFLRMTNHSLIRFADGDVKIMQAIDVVYQTADQTLARRMSQALTDPPPLLAVGVPDCFSGFSQLNKGYVGYYSQQKYQDFFRTRLRHDKQYLLAHISSPAWHSMETHCTLVQLVYNNLREIWKGKDLIILRGNNTQTYTYDVYDTARSQKQFYAPRYNGWAAYSELKATMLKQNPDAIYIMAAGPVGKVLTYDLTLLGRRALDLGHLAKDYDMFLGKKSSRNFFID